MSFIQFPWQNAKLFTLLTLRYIHKYIRSRIHIHLYNNVIYRFRFRYIYFIKQSSVLKEKFMMCFPAHRLNMSRRIIMGIREYVTIPNSKWIFGKPQCVNILI